MSEKKRVLFVCIENSCRSQMAEALARMNALDLFEAYSAGSRPSGEVNPFAIEAMREYGYELGDHRSKSLKDIPQGKYEYVITMGCGDECPFIPAIHHEDWKIPDPKGGTLDAFRVARGLIEAHIKNLVQKVRVENAKP
jgi:arsenate reductase (thioredoxin)